MQVSEEERSTFALVHSAFIIAAMVQRERHVTMTTSHQISMMRPWKHPVGVVLESLVELQKGVLMTFKWS